MCIHDSDDDFTSGQLKKHHIKEKSIVKYVLDFLLSNPETVFIDIGAHVGLYSILVTKMGRDVLAVKAFSENIFRLHKAANLNNVQKKIILINNALSDKNGMEIELKKHKNIGEQSLLGQKPSYRKNDYSVNTIILDDLVPFIPKQENGSIYRKAVMKIDIQGFEPYAFVHASKLFKVLDFQIIVMEWHQIV